MKTNKRSLFLCAFFISCALCVQTALADETYVKVLLDGSEITYEIPPQIISGRTMVPLRATIEAITGEDMIWDDASKTVTFNAGGHTNKHTIGEKTVYIDGEPMEFDAPSQILDGRTLVPVRMIAETSGCNVEWDAANYSVLITSGAGGSGAALNIVLKTENVEVKGNAINGKPGETVVLGYYSKPTVTGLGDTDLEMHVNEYLTDLLTENAAAFINEYNEFLKEIAAETDAEYKAVMTDMAGGYEFGDEATLFTSSEHYCSVAEVLYQYMGGAHPTTYVIMHNLDIPGKKFMTLGDVFKSDAYIERLEEYVNNQAQNDEYKDKLYPDTEITVDSDTNFFIMEGMLILLYQPYDIGPYSSGFISFAVPFTEIADLMKDVYVTDTYKQEFSSDETAAEVVPEYKGDV